MNKKIFYIPIAFFLIIFILFLVRLIFPSEIDDVSPGIPCPELKQYNPDVLWVIPKFNNISISENKIWCKYILSLNKTIGLHGVTHGYNEFETDRNPEYLEEGISIFENCFGFKPTMFKPPQLKISKGNKRLIKQNNLTLKLDFNQITRKVYHCNDSDWIKNWIVNIF